MANVNDTMAAMQRMIEALTATLEQNRGSSTPSPPRDDGIEKFGGDRQALPVFLGKVEWLFESHAAYFDNDAKKIAFVVNRLEGVPAQTIIAIKSRAGPVDPVVTSWDSLKEYLRLNYGDVNEKVTAESNLYQLRQTSSAAEYFALFRQYVAILGWVDSPQLVSQAKQGLRSQIKDELAREGRVFTSLAEFMGVAVALDNRLWERQEEKRKEAEVRQRIREEVQKSAEAKGTSKKFGAVATLRASSPPLETGPPREPLPPRPPRRTAPTVSPEEIERRRVTGACFKCGGNGHAARDCVVGYRSTASNVADVKPTLAAVVAEKEYGSTM